MTGMKESKVINCIVMGRQSKLFQFELRRVVRGKMN